MSALLLAHCSKVHQSQETTLETRCLPAVRGASVDNETRSRALLVSVPNARQVRGTPNHYFVNLPPGSVIGTYQSRLWIAVDQTRYLGFYKPYPGEVGQVQLVGNRSFLGISL